MTGDGDIAGPVRERLDAPLRTDDAAGVCRVWFRQVAIWRLDGYAPFAADFGLIGRIRGAFGEALLAGASDAARAGRPCVFDPPSAFEVLWRKQGRIAPGFEHACPFVIQLDPRRDALGVSLTLFGFAGEWMPAALEAMTIALARVDWAGARGGFVPRLSIAGRRVETHRGVETVAAARGARLELVSPLAVTGLDARERPAGLIVNLARRVGALARWHDGALDVDLADLGARARALGFRFDVHVASWTRGSKRQNRVLPMSGLVGELDITGEIDSEIGALLALGATCHWGADIAYGCGRYEIVGGD